MRFVQDVFLENYDPTIEGASSVTVHLNVTWGAYCIVFAEAYRRVLDIDGVKTSVRSRVLLLIPTPFAKVMSDHLCL